MRRGWSALEALHWLIKLALNYNCKLSTINYRSTGCNRQVAITKKQQLVGQFSCTKYLRVPIPTLVLAVALLYMAVMYVRRVLGLKTYTVFL